MAVKKNARRFHKLTDRHVEAMFDFSEDAEPTFVWDSKVHGLRLRVGKHKATWTFFVSTDGAGSAVRHIGA